MSQLDELTKVRFEVLGSFVRTWAKAFNELTVHLNRMFPNGVAEKQLRRQAAHLVHTAYRQKRGKRW